VTVSRVNEVGRAIHNLQACLFRPRVAGFENGLCPKFARAVHWFLMPVMQVIAG
jgi:hypothetical protein